MNTGPIHAELAVISGHAFRRWFYRLGGIGLIPLGLLDSSVIPIPGSMDVLTIVLSARQQDLWFYYALMATAGSVLGALLTYRLGRKGGKKTEKKLRRWHLEKIKRIFKRWGFSAVAVPALMPPPVPMVPFVIAAGVMQYPMKKFISAMVAGRVIRYMVLAYLAGRYGRRILHPGPVIWVALTVLIGAAVVAFFLWREIRNREPAHAS